LEYQEEVGLEFASPSFTIFIKMFEIRKGGYNISGTSELVHLAKSF